MRVEIDSPTYLHGSCLNFGESSMYSSATDLVDPEKENGRDFESSNIGLEEEFERR